MGKSKRVKRIHKGGRPRMVRPDVDLGTPELVAKRQSLAADPALSTCPLDVALSKGMIDRDQHAAASYFAACRALVFGSPHVKATDLLRVSGGIAMSHASTAEIKYRVACDGLRRRGPLVLEDVENFVVHEHMPQWLTQARAGRERDRVMEGLAVLVGWYRGRRRAS
jgi:hypothetical protein